MQGSVLIFVVGLVVVLFIVAQFSWEGTRSITMLQKWADQNGWELASAERRYSTLGTPFWLTAGKNRTVYRITVRNAHGELLTGYALCGGWFLGLWSDRVEVKLDR